MKAADTQLYQVTAPHFCAGIIVADGFIIKAAPILRWAYDRSLNAFEDYCVKKCWGVILISEPQGLLPVSPSA
jgi:hypothetical protein